MKVRKNQLRRGAVQVVAVEDDALFRELIANELAAQGFAVSIYPDAESLLEVPEVAAAADAIVLNWQLPGLSGTELLGELRRRGIDRPVVFLTGRPLVANELAGVRGRRPGLLSTRHAASEFSPDACASSPTTRPANAPSAGCRDTESSF